MEQYIPKSAFVAKIEKLSAYLDSFHEQRIIEKILSIIDTLEVKEVDLELVTDWFDHIAQIADDRMTLTGQRMTDSHALDEIKCIAKNSSEFITKHYKAQKREEL